MIEISFHEHTMADGSVLLEVSTYASSFAMRPGICGLYLVTKDSLQFLVYALPALPELIRKEHEAKVQEVLGKTTLVGVKAGMGSSKPKILPSNTFIRIQRYLSWGAVEVIHLNRNKEVRTRITDRRFGAAFCERLFQRLCEFYGPRAPLQTMPATLGETVRLPLIVLGITSIYFAVLFLITLADPTSVKPQMIEVRGLRAFVLFINRLGPLIVGALFAAVLLGLGVWTVRRVRKQPGKEVLDLRGS